MSELSDREFENIQHALQSSGDELSLPKQIEDGTDWPEYRGLKRIDRGATAWVYEAEHMNTAQKVAIKVLFPQYAEDAKFKERFLKEAGVLATCSHPGIVKVIGSGTHDGYLFIAMEFIPGPTLKERVQREGPFNEDVAIRVLGHLCEALGHLHKQGAVHRDISWKNIKFREDGSPVLLDLGLVHVQGSPGELTAPGLRMGTPGFMSPEQARGDSAKADRRSDLFSVGCVTYYMLTGKTPFLRESYDDSRTATLSFTPPRPGSPRLDDICQMLLDKDPALRYETAHGVLEQLERAKAGRVPKRPPYLAWAAIVIALAVIGYIGSVHLTTHNEHATREDLGKVFTPEALAGTWKWNGSILEEYRADGTVSSDGGSLAQSWAGKWTVTDKDLTIFRLSVAGGYPSSGIAEVLSYRVKSFRRGEMLVLLRPDGKNDTVGVPTSERPLSEEEYLRRDALEHRPSSETEYKTRFDAANNQAFGLTTDRRSAVVAFKRLFYSAPETALGHKAAYSAGCTYSLLGDTSTAIRWLERSVAFGFGATPEDREQLNRGDVLDAVRRAYPERLAALISKAPKKRAWMGVDVADSGAALRIEKIVPGSPAERAGLHRGDIIMAIDEDHPSTKMELTERLRMRDVGSKTSLTLTRGTSTLTVDVALEAVPK